MTGLAITHCRNARPDPVKCVKECGSDACSRQAFALEAKRFTIFPSAYADVLPTRLGNAIAAWEHYPYRRYRIDAITMWPRLAPLLPKAMAASISAAKERFDLLLNSSVLSLVFGMVWIAVRDIHLFTVTGAMNVGGFAAAALAFARLAIAAAGWWGENVKSAFDLYRLEILRRIGVKLPNQWTPQEERTFWEELQWSMKFDRLPNVTLRLPPPPERDEQKSEERNGD